MKTLRRSLLLLTVAVLSLSLCACCCIPFGGSTPDTPTVTPDYDYDFDYDYDNGDTTTTTTTTPTTSRPYNTTVFTTTTEPTSYTLAPAYPTESPVTVKPTTKAPTKATTKAPTKATTKATTAKPTTATTKAPAASSSVINVPKLAKTPYTVPSATASATTLTPATIHSITDSIAKGEEDTFSYTAPRSGHYTFYFSNTSATISTYIYVYDSLGERIGYDSWFGNGDKLALTLEGGKTYTIKISYYSGSGSYTLNIGQQTPTTDITPYTAVTDSIVFSNQYNFYTFTPSISGDYTFYFSNTNASISTYIYVYDSLDNRIGYDSWFSNGDKLTVSLDANETYTVYVQYYSGTGNYTLNIGKQTATVDISSYSAVTDRIAYANQTNNYTFKPTTSGYYAFSLSNTKASISTYIYIYNSLGERIDYDSWFSNGDSLKVYLEGGKTYSVVMEYYSGTGDYTLNIGKQKSTVSITDGNTVKDSLEFKGQQNVYRYAPKTSGNHSITISGNGSNYVQISVKDAWESSVASDSYFRNGDSLTFNATAGATYTVYVTYYSYTTDYTLNVK